jgi:hypothetical protein
MFENDIQKMRKFPFYKENTPKISSSLSCNLANILAAKEVNSAVI